MTPKHFRTVSKLCNSLIFPIKQDSKQIFETFDEKYQLENEKFGHGYYGNMSKCLERTTGKEYLLKIVDKLFYDTEEEVEELLNQIQVLRGINHEHVLQVMDTFSTSSNIYIVFEYHNGVDILTDISAREEYSEKEAASVIKKILDATACMHKNNVIHKDLKAENILVDAEAGKLKIIDFGTA